MGRGVRWVAMAVVALAWMGCAAGPNYESKVAAQDADGPDTRTCERACLKQFGRNDDVVRPICHDRCVGEAIAKSTQLDATPRPHGDPEVVTEQASAAKANEGRLMQNEAAKADTERAARLVCGDPFVPCRVRPQLAEPPSASHACSESRAAREADRQALAAQVAAYEQKNKEVETYCPLTYHEIAPTLVADEQSGIVQVVAAGWFEKNYPECRPGTPATVRAFAKASWGVSVPDFVLRYRADKACRASDSASP